MNKGGTIVLGEDFFFENFYRDDKGKIIISNYLNNELSEAIRYLNKKGISLEIMAGPPLRYMFTKN